MAKVKIKEIADTMDISPAEMPSFLNREKGEIVSIHEEILPLKSKLN